MIEPVDNPARTSIDINCDVGESTAERLIGNDGELIPLISSANIACGGHGGDEKYIRRAVATAIAHGVQIGAHPGYPDPLNFGRRPMVLSNSDLAATLKQQLTYLQRIVDCENGKLAYVKPHGALYHRCNSDQNTAEVLLNIVTEYDPSLAIMGLAGSCLEQLCRQSNVRYIREAFADRQYQITGQIKPRSQPNAVLASPQAIAEQAVLITGSNVVATESNQLISVVAESICVHGDHPQATAAIHEIIKAMNENDLVIKQF